LRKPYNGFIPYPSPPFSLEQLDINVEAFARIWRVLCVDTLREAHQIIRKEN